MNHVYIVKVPGNLDLFTESRRVRDHSDFLIAIQQKPKLQTYILLKDNVNIEPYVLSFLPKYQRSVFAKLHYGILPLGIETGRYHNIRLEECTCELCQSNENEDEIHFICRCNFQNVKYTALFNGIFEIFEEFIHFNDTNIFFIFDEAHTKTAFKIYMGKILVQKKLII